MSEERTTRPRRCTRPSGYGDDCGGTRFNLLENGDYQCIVCKWENPPARVTTTELRIAKCRDCDESFLWKWQDRHHAMEAPDRCRACDCAASAYSHECAAANMRRRAGEYREQQRRAVARFKPPEAAVLPGRGKIG